MKLLGSLFETIGIYTTRHPGRDSHARVGQDPDVMDGSLELRTPIFS